HSPDSDINISTQRPASSTSSVTRRTTPSQDGAAVSRQSTEQRTMQSSNAGVTVADAATRPSTNSASVSGQQQRKIGLVGRGFPPPIPPNKPQVFIASSSQSSSTQASRPGAGP